VIGKRHRLVNEDLQKPLDIVVDETGPDQRKRRNGRVDTKSDIKAYIYCAHFACIPNPSFLILPVYLKKDIYLAVLVNYIVNSTWKHND
jgi:hypothetical protein